MLQLRRGKGRYVPPQLRNPGVGGAWATGVFLLVKYDYRSGLGVSLKTRAHPWVEFLTIKTTSNAMKGATLFQRLPATGLSSSKIYRSHYRSPFSPSFSSSARSQSLSMSDHSPTKYDKFFRYTSGRWLWDEEKQLQDRFTPFNVLELQRIAAGSTGANKCVAMTKLAEGSFNKTFRLKMDNGSTAIARIPHPIAGPKYYTSASEVATMDFVRPIFMSSTICWTSGLLSTTGPYSTPDTCPTGSCMERTRR